MSKFSQNRSTIDFIAAFHSITEVATSFYTTSTTFGRSGYGNARNKAAYGECALIERRHDGAYCIRLGHHIRMTQTRNDRHRHIGTL